MTPFTPDSPETDDPPMTSPRRGRPPRLAPAALLALAVLACAPAAANAGCGHGAVSAADRANSEALAGLEALGADIGTLESATPAPARPPCSGPSCSERRSEPVAPAPAGPERADRWFRALPPLPPDPGPQGRPLHLTPPLRPVHRTDALERPPRVPPA